MFDQNKYLTVSVAGFVGQDEFTLVVPHLLQNNNDKLNFYQPLRYQEGVDLLSILNLAAFRSFPIK